MLPFVLILLVRLSPGLSQTQDNSPKHYQFHPYHQPLHHSYQQRLHQQPASENRRHQRTLLPPRNLRNPVIRLKNTDSSRHLSSPAYRFQPHSPRQRKPVLSERQQRLLNRNPVQHFKRKPILIRPSSERVKPRIQNKKKPFLNSRETRKIANTKLKLGGKNDLKKKYNPDENKKDKKKLYLKDDNIAIESQVVETKVKVPKLATKPANLKAKYEQKLAKVKKPKKPYLTNKVKPVDTPNKRTYNSAPATPQFIIKQAGPSQQFGWIGHGTYAPLDIPNIFKAAGLNTRWIPEVDELFEAGLTYPAAPSPVAQYAQDKLRIEDPVQETKPAQTYSAQPSPVSSPKYKASNSVPVPSFKSPPPSTPQEEPAVAPAYEGSVSTPSHEAPAIAPAYKAPVSTSSYEAPAPPPDYKAPAPAPASNAPVATSTYEAAASPASYEAPAPAPAYKAPVSTSTYEAPAPAPAYKPPKQTTKPTQASTSFYGSQSIDLSSSSKIIKSNPFLTTTRAPVTIYQPSTTNPPVSTTAPRISSLASVSTARPVYSSPVAFTGSPTPTPFTASPSPASFTGSPTPSVYKSSPGYFVQPSYKPSTFFRSTGKPFTAFIGSPEPAASLPDLDLSKNNIASPKYEAKKPSIELEKSEETENQTPADPEDGEVFYIFYENEQNPLDSVQSGLDLQRYIHEEIQKSKDDSEFSASEARAEIFEDTPNDIVEPVFSIVEESNKPKQPIYFDVPIKIEENGEGFDPPTEIRTIFVPVENAINIPNTFDISVGTSFGYNKNNKETFPNFSSESDSSYNNPISSYDAPIAPSTKENSFSDNKQKKDSINLNEGPEKKSVRRVRKPKPKKSIGKFSYDPVESSLSSIPYGTRLGPRDQYDPLVIRR